MAVHNQPFTQRILAIAELPKIQGKHDPQNSDENSDALGLNPDGLESI
jgi:hypothetical protein